MNTRALMRAVAACALSCTVLPAAFAAELQMPREGWVSWEVPAVDNAPAWCCFEHSRGDGNRATCLLDQKKVSIVGGNGEKTELVRVYARVKDGNVDRVRAFSASCPVQAETRIQSLGTVSADDSARWLGSLLKEPKLRDGVVEHAISALAIHHGKVAQDAMVAIARHDPRRDARRHAIFMLAHLRGTAGAQVATSLMFDDPDADVRQHAAFAVSQSMSPSAEKDLIRLATSDAAADVRSHAWFALSQTKSALMEAAIGEALRSEPNRGVREHAIFALSQLPEERATSALIKIAEDKSLDREERKRAVFLLAQSEASAAQAYLERVLAQAAR